MIQSHVLLTQTFVEKDKISKIIAYNLLQKKQSWQTLTWEIPDNLDASWQHFLSQNQIIVANYTDKEDFREDVLNLYTFYPDPTLLFLGDLSTYSLPLQEGMLKLLEEPPHNLEIILFAQNRTEILPTISSRCQFHLLPKQAVHQYLDQKLLEKTKSKLPNVLDFCKQLIGNTWDMPDVSKVEREELHFWLWQISSYLQEFYKQSPTAAIGLALHKTLEAMKLNTQNLQKKFVLANLK